MLSLYQLFESIHDSNLSVVLTGGPCAGKTYIISKLKQITNYLIVPEVATLLFSQGFKTPKKITKAWQYRFQKAIIAKQLELENKIKPVNVVVLDRGILDGAAYIDGGVKEFCRKFNLNEEDVLKRYDVVIHLVSLAQSNPKEYERLKTSNPHRFETLEMAKETEKRTLEAWKNHPNRYILDGTLQSNYTQVLNIIKTHLK